MLKWYINQLDLQSRLLNHHQTDMERLTSEVFKENVFPGSYSGSKDGGCRTLYRLKRPPEASRSVIFPPL